jgi:hypothetical protein
MEKNTANLTLELLLGIVVAAITTAVLIAAATGHTPISVENVRPLKNPWIGLIPVPKNLA